MPEGIPPDRTESPHETGGMGTDVVIAITDYRTRESALLAVQKVDFNDGMEVVIRKQKKQRGSNQNALMWASAIRDIAAQVWPDGVQYDSDTWHEYFKREFLPEEASNETVDSYVKWGFLPNGNRYLKGSTTQLTKKGFAVYLEKIYAFGAQHGVQFGVREEMFA